MLASRLRTTRAVAGGLALASLLCWVPGSQAAVHTGSATDAADDLSPFAGDQLPDPPTSFTNVAVKYDDAAGRVDVTYTFDQSRAPGQEIHAGVGLGTTRADGSCSAPFFTSLGWHVLAGEARGESAVEGDSTNFAGDVTGESFSFDDETAWESTVLSDWPGADKTWNFATTTTRSSASTTTARPPACGWWAPRLTPVPARTSWRATPSRLPPRRPNPSRRRSTPPATEPAPGTTVPPNTSNGSQSGAPRFTSTKARRAVKKALAHRYGKAFSAREDYERHMREEELLPLELHSRVGLRPLRVQGQGGAHQALRRAHRDPALAAQDEVDPSGAQADGRRCVARYWACASPFSVIRSGSADPGPGLSSPGSGANCGWSAAA